MDVCVCVDARLILVLVLGRQIVYGQKTVYVVTVFGLMHTVRCGFDGIPTVRFGAVLRIGNLTVRFGAVLGCCKSYGAVLSLIHI